MTTTPTLSRPLDDRWIGGVCSGVARRFGFQPKTVRILAVVSCVLPGPSVLAYLALWILVPNAPEQTTGYSWS